MSDWYDRNGRRLPPGESERLLSDDAYKVVKQTWVGDLWVSTVWLGIDHSFGQGPPLIFETMVFPRDTWNEVYGFRYATENDARYGHAVVVQALEAGKDPPDDPLDAPLNLKLPLDSATLSSGIEIDSQEE